MGTSSLWQNVRNITRIYSSAKLDPFTVCVPIATVYAHRHRLHPSPPPGDLYSTFDLSDFAYSSDITHVEAYGIGPFVTDLPHLAWCPQGSPAL